MKNVWKMFVFLWCSFFAILLGILGIFLFITGAIGCLILIGYPIMKLGELVLEQAEDVFLFGCEYSEEAICC